MVKYNTLDPKLAKIAGIVEKHMKTPLNLELVIDDSFGEYSGRINGHVLSAATHIQLLDLAGRVLRHPELTETDTAVKSHKEICGMYFASHFHNFLDSAPLEEIYIYLDELALWGMNTFSIWFDLHHFRNMEEGRDKADRTIAIMKYARSIGVQVILTTISNEAFEGSPENLRADWTCGHDGYIYPLNDHYHLEICPSIHGGIEQILKYRRQFLEVFKDTQPDFVSIGAYDEGGCSCTKCAPWGSNGYIRTVQALIPLYKAYFPNTKLIISLWQFGTFTGNDEEFIGMKDAINRGDLGDNVAYFVSEPQYARYPFAEGMPLPIIGFPEISMFNANPWGGYGANPLPSLLKSLWERDGDKLEGGIPYSEGFYEDVNKIIMLRYYRDNQDADESIQEYLAWEFGLEGEALERMGQAIWDLEETWKRSWDKETHRCVIENPKKVSAIAALIREIDAKLPAEVRISKRWRQIFLRAVIDEELLKNDFYRNDVVMGYFNELIALYHLEKADKKHIKPDIWD